MPDIIKEEIKRSVYTAGQWRIIWISFKRHRLAVVSGIFLIIVYVVSIFAEFFAPYDPHHRDMYGAFVPPMRIHLIGEDGKLRSPFIYTLEQDIAPTLMPFYTEDKTEMHPIRLFHRGDPYKLWGLFKSDIHLFGVEGEQRLYVLGTDKQGRDMFSRTIYAARLSMSVGLVGVTISFVLGLVLGSISGYIGGVADTIIQRIIEVLRCIPSLPLWMALAVAIPLTWPIARVFFAITVILSFISWPGLARVVRGKFLYLKQTEYVMAAVLDNAKQEKGLVS